MTAVCPDCLRAHASPECPEFEIVDHSGDAAAWETVRAGLDDLDCAASPESVEALASLKAAYEAMERERDYFDSRLGDFSRVAQADFARAEAAERERDDALQLLYKPAEYASRLASAEARSFVGYKGISTRSGELPDASLSEDTRICARADDIQELEAALREIAKQASPRDWETPGHPMNEWTKREPILRIARAALAIGEGKP